MGSLPPPPDDSTVNLVELSSADQRYKYVEDQVSTYVRTVCVTLEQVLA